MNASALNWSLRNLCVLCASVVYMLFTAHSPQRRRGRRGRRGYADVLVAMFCLMYPIHVVGQDDWARKHFSQWDRKDVNRVLDGSPWVVKQEVRLKFANQLQVAAGAPSTNVGNIGGPTLVRTDQNTVALGAAQAPVDFVFTLRLRSGLPIRAALLRAKQLDSNYDALDEKGKAAFGEKWDGILQCPACAQNYVLTLTSSSKQERGADAVYTIFKGARLAELQRYVFVANEKGEKRELVHFVPPKAPGDEAIFYFSRFDEKGKPLFNAQSKELHFNLNNNEVNVITNFRVDLSHLKIDGEISF